MQLRQSLFDLLSPTPSFAGVKVVISLCHRMAATYLRQKARAGRFNLPVLSLRLDDLAWDCLADLFERDANGVFVKLASYFRVLQWENRSDDELFIALRRLIFSQVNQAVYRNYRETDPSLGKILRNLKKAVIGSPYFVLSHYHGELQLSLQAADQSSCTLPEMPPEFLEAHLTAALRGEPDMKQVLQLLADILAAQHDYRPSFPLTGLALIIRTSFVHVQTVLEQDGNGHDQFSAEEISEMISRSVTLTKGKTRAAYVGKQKIDSATFEAYFQAIGGWLAAEFIGNGSADFSYYEFLHRYLPELTRDDYHRRFRCQVEYLARLVREALLQELKKEI